MNLKTTKPILEVFLELIFKNLFWYLVFSVIYFDTNPMNWWMVTSIWGRVILVFLELGILTSTFNDGDENEKNIDG